MTPTPKTDAVCSYDTVKELARTMERQLTTLTANYAAAVTELRADPWIEPLDLWRKLADADECMTRACFHDRLHHPRCPHYQRKLGPSGRLLTLRPTAELLAWLRKPAQPGKRL